MVSGIHTSSTSIIQSYSIQTKSIKFFMNQPAFVLEFPPISGYHSQCMHFEYSTKMQPHVISFNLSIGGLT